LLRSERVWANKTEKNATKINVLHLRHELQDLKRLTLRGLNQDFGLLWLVCKTYKRALSFPRARCLNFFPDESNELTKFLVPDEGSIAETSAIYFSFETQTSFALSLQ